MKKAYFLIFLTALAMVAIAWQIAASQKSDPALDSFAQCLTGKGATMYGAEWCSHCQNQKKKFGQSFRRIKYVECPDNTELCLSQGIQGYPTWIIGDKKYAGEQDLEELSEISGCALL